MQVIYEHISQEAVENDCEQKEIFEDKLKQEMAFAVERRRMVASRRSRRLIWSYRWARSWSSRRRQEHQPSQGYIVLPKWGG